MNYEVAADKKFPQSWRVEAIDFDGDGDCFVTVFDGPHAEKRAREYAAWKQAEGDTRELKAALRWIPVEEKLPDTTDSYLVWVRGIGDDGEMFKESVEAVFSCDRKHWTVQHGWLSHEVQGWMPMPKPPELG